jgi:hypothetical protein
MNWLAKAAHTLTMLSMILDYAALVIGSRTSEATFGRNVGISDEWWFRSGNGKAISGSCRRQPGKRVDASDRCVWTNNPSVRVLAVQVCQYPQTVPSESHESGE